MAKAPCCQNPVWRCLRRFVDRLEQETTRWRLQDSRLIAVLSSIWPAEGSVGRFSISIHADQHARGDTVVRLMKARDDPRR